MNKDKLKEYIENIEQLSADSRYWNDYENYEKLEIELKSIIYWVNKAIKLIEKEK